MILHQQLSVLEQTGIDVSLKFLGEGRAFIDEVGASRFTLMTSSCWNGIAMGDVTTKEHADIGMRIADYPTIQVSRKRKDQLNNHPSSQSINQLVK